MKTTRKYFVKAVAVFMCIAAGSAHAVLTTARGTASQKQMLASTNNVINVTWSVGVSPSHINGATSSAPASIFNPSVLGGPLTTLGGALTRTGAGPFAFSETLTVSGAQVQGWISAGMTRVVLRRTFTDLIAASTVVGDVTLTLNENSLSGNRNGAKELTIQRLRIALDDKQSIVKLVAEGSVLHPQLTVNYAGNGVLDGKWQVAEPGSTEGKPLYRTLTLVRQPLMKAQESAFQGPLLPTSRPGKYLLRFCVAPREQTNILTGGDSACPQPELTVQTAYQVMPGETSVNDIAVKAPIQESVNNTTPFAWEPIANTAVYKLDVFEKQGEQQWFVTGILLPSNQTQTAISQVMQQKLDKGGLYFWQISAIDAEGKILAKSKPLVFSYQP